MKFLRTTSLAYIRRNHNYNESVSEIGHLHAKRRSFRHVSSFRVLRHFGMFDFGMFKRNLRLNSVARRRRDSSPREKKWFDAMCEEPFDAVAKVVVHSCGKLNVVLSVFVALTTNSIYIAVLLRPGTFPFWYRHRAYDLRAGVVFFVGHRLKSS